MTIRAQSRNAAGFWHLARGLLVNRAGACFTGGKSMPRLCALLTCLVLLSITQATPAFAAGLDRGDTAWMLTSTALVLMMTIPGLALFYGGMVRKKNVLATVMQSFAITRSEEHTSELQSHVNLVCRLLLEKKKKKKIKT